MKKLCFYFPFVCRYTFYEVIQDSNFRQVHLYLLSYSYFTSRSYIENSSSKFYPGYITTESHWLRVHFINFAIPYLLLTSSISLHKLRGQKKTYDE